MPTCLKTSRHFLFLKSETIGSNTKERLCSSKEQSSEHKKTAWNGTLIQSRSLLFLKRANFLHKSFIKPPSVLKKKILLCCLCFGGVGILLAQKTLKLTPTVTWYEWPDTNYKQPNLQQKDTTSGGMIYVPSGFTQIGAVDGLPTEQPPFWVFVEAFLMDEHPVTVAEFRAFINATSYITEAETFGNAGVFDLQTAEWKLLDGATWHHPMGQNNLAAPDNHPVTQVSYNDANAYATWANKRLPTEMEWEHAARNARNDRNNFPFGDSLLSPDGQYLANIWQGYFPLLNTEKDGYLFTSPVGHFGKTPIGLTDMSGNVWQWTSNDRFEYNTVATLGLRASTTEKTMRGGSFMCNERYCFGYRVSGRSFATPETSLFHVGFRCVRSEN